MGTCRFCDDFSTDAPLQYGIRHYAHFNCFLDHRPLSDLKPWKINQFPFRLLKERGLLEEAERLTAKERA